VTTGETIRRARIDHGLTQRQLAARCGCSHGRISRIESGHSMPSPRLARRLETALDCPAGSLAVQERRGRKRSRATWSAAQGAEIRTARIARGLTQQQLATMVGVCHQAVSDWEAGKRSPTHDHYCALMQALHVELTP
jgi:transcriptional regulator with XRE-family HTH domain